MAHASPASDGEIAFITPAGPAASQTSSSSALPCAAGTPTLAIANPDGTNCQTVHGLFAGLSESTPAWNPSATALAFTGTTNGISRLFVVRLKPGSEAMTLGGTCPPQSGCDPSWSPNGKQIAFAEEVNGNGQIVIVHASSGARVAQLTEGPEANTEPAWSPNGTQIAFVSNRDGSDQIYLINENGSEQRPLTDDGMNDTSPAWSPSGTTLAFTAEQGDEENIRTIPADGGPEMPVSTAGDDTDPAWSPDGSWLAYTQSGDSIIVQPASRAAGQSPVSFAGSQPSWGRLPAASTPVPGTSIEVAPPSRDTSGDVKVAPGGSSLLVALFGPATVPASATAPTEVVPTTAAPATVKVTISGGFSSTITITGGPVDVSQPQGGAPVLTLISPCAPTAAATTAQSGRKSTTTIKDKTRRKKGAKGKLPRVKTVSGTTTYAANGTVVTYVQTCNGTSVTTEAKVLSGSVSIENRLPSGVIQTLGTLTSQEPPSSVTAATGIALATSGGAVSFYEQPVGATGWTQQQVPGLASAAPSLAEVGCYPAIALQGPDDSLDYDQLTTAGWQVEQVAGNGTTFSAPSLAQVGRGAVIAAEGPANTLMLYSQPPGATMWTSETVASDGSTFSPPSVTQAGNSIVVAAEGGDNSLDYYWQTTGTTKWTAEPVAGPRTTLSAPSLADVENSTVIAAEGLGHSLDYYWQTTGTTTWTMETIAGSPIATAGVSPSAVAPGTTFSTPSVAQVGNSTVVAAEGLDHSLDYYWQTIGSRLWHPEVVEAGGLRSGTTFSAPSLAQVGGSSVIAAVGAGNTLDYYWQAIGTVPWKPETVSQPAISTGASLLAPSVTQILTGLPGSLCSGG